EPGVEIADIGIGVTHDLAIQLEPNPQHAVRARMVWPHVELHPFGFRLVFGADRLLGDVGLNHGWRRAPTLRVSDRSRSPAPQTRRNPCAAGNPPSSVA